ncbi:glucoamylase family protein [Cytophagaceae bacterium BD1B2-1]|uniref:Glucoamylase family protein n=2 Tax=Xanthocytophaga agilis TaxID=3048010 RepID=A0AAE3R5C0_9BACT|nr:glucoamylase family protein [Xanthocytophaga agilis]
MSWYSYKIGFLFVCTLLFVFTIQGQTSLTPATEQSEYMETVQKATFKYFWDFAHPVSGMTPERTATPTIVTSGGTGFGVMCLVVGVQRGWITREQAVSHLTKMTKFLSAADRFHGAWSHWLDGRTGKVVPFGEKDNGGDLVETAYLVNGLLVARAYFDQQNPQETQLRDQITKLWETVEWDWYASHGDGHLYWHWSPNYEWAMNMPIRGYNECLITYVLALGSPTHAIKPEVYQNTWKKSDFYTNGNQYLGYTLPLGFPYGGPLFFAHYSYLSLDPRKMDDGKTNYWKLNLAQTLINYTHCVSQGEKFGYSTDNWGLTASDDYNFYDAHSPTNDNGTISPTAALSSFPYTPYASYQAMRYFYLKKGNPLFGPYGFYDAFSQVKNWYSNQYLAIDQGPIVVMMENYRSGLIWKLGAGIAELTTGLKKMGITTPSYPTGFYMYLPDPKTNEVDLMRHTDRATYILDIAVKGKESVKLELTDRNGKVETVLLNKALTEGIHEIPFVAKGGKYQAILSQGTKQEKVLLNLR